jgi:glycosyltransferase involved in cell wall biosynthesis
MRVLIDASSILLRSAGIKSYTWHWVQAMRELAAPGDVVDAFPLLGAGLGQLVHERSALSAWATWPRLGLLHAANVATLPALDWAVRGAAVFHASNQVRRAPRRIPVTATLHDLTTRVLPEFHTPANVRADQAFFDRIVRPAPGLIAISENTRNDAVRHLGLHPARIEVIYNGVAASYFEAAPNPALAGRYGIDRPYVLFVGALEPRKNVDRLLDAWLALRADLRREFALVVAGSAGWRAGSTELRLKAGVEGVRWLGYVPEPDLPALTAGATLFAYPSLYEGFGIPMAQAMAAGVAVLTSNTSCLPEVAGDGGLCVDPRSVAEITAAVDRMLGSPDLRASLGAAGRRRAQALYQWPECARRSLEFFRRICGL